MILVTLRDSTDDSIVLSMVTLQSAFIALHAVINVGGGERWTRVEFEPTVMALQSIRKGFLDNSVGWVYNLNQHL